jgi:hypothetical protein
MIEDLNPEGENFINTCLKDNLKIYEGIVDGSK